MLAYLIKSILCLLVLWGFYKIALEQTAAHQFNRFYLLGSLVIALTLPLLTFSYTVEVKPQPVVAEMYLNPTALTEVPVTTPVDEPTNWLAISLGIIYAAGVVLFGFRFLRNLIQLRKKINTNENVQAKSHINVLLAGKVIPHSFLQYIFLPRKAFKQDAIAPEILAHEQAHVTQKHSWDILAVEFLQVIFWFNPLLVFLKRSIALNHEFLADQSALEAENTIENYTNLLFIYSGGAHHTALSSPINYSLTKKRILMLSKTRSVKKLATRLALFVPVLALCIYFFNQEIVAKPHYKVIENETPNVYTIEYDDELDSLKRAEITKRFKSQTFNGEHPSKEQLKKWTEESFKIQVDSKNIIAKKLAEFKPTDFAIYNGVKTTDTVSGKMVNAFVNLVTNEYYQSHKRMQNPPSGEEVKAYLAQNEKVLNLIVIESQIWLNGTETSVENFAKDLDAISKDWTSSEKRNYSIHVRTTDPTEKLWLKLQTAFETTDLYKANPKGLIPPPPPPVPAAPDAGTPPPPPAPVSPASFNEENYTLLNIKLSKTDAIEIEGQQTTISNVKKFIKKHFKYWTKDNPEKPRAVIFHLPEGVSEGQAHKAFKEIQDFKINSFTLKKEGNETDLPAPPPVPAAPNAGTPPPPPPAPSTQEMVDMAKDNIYYNVKKISPAKAKSLMKESDNYNILMTSFKGKKALIINDKE
ncbi:beta-lactamase regulating signal transducer with metallopeptidase domain [Leeuwenhoekiella aestuarii]|uniref:Beta-lactamase regulating signal transducer with metallopeptidase domain n=1 Tax=Leeuwenhoekiella aestuarii TaxID=2249426 RepID=A0A4Q0NZV1_9FLAO|nr:M56 family metallopeptidase [Leeuwenhoekiella aestuarii]RXG18520.1 beta-lactamase regulating signal transducer with metallopeptidase domain [Leeuwenhoekiella aestuarii]RXG19825.1 beta-lactamase regulating signal transducer with metallopeptidase domain [Leeuwenhoekiella aestuarii]